MQLRFIERYTKFEIEVVADSGYDYETECFNGEFVDMEGDLSFSIICDELHERFLELSKHRHLKFAFYRGSEVFTFLGKMLETLSKNRVNVVLVNAISLVEKSSRRKAPRIKMATGVKIYLLPDNDANQPGLLEGTGVSNDISSTGFSLFTNDELNVMDGQLYMSEFSISLTQIFRLPVTLIRRGDCPQSRLYKYDYAFSFTLNDDSEAIRSLTIAMLEHKIKSI